MQIPLFAHVASVSFFLPPFFGFRFWKQHGIPMKLFALFSLYAALHVLSEFILGRLNINNHFLLNLFDLVSFQCIIYLYYRRIEHKGLKDFFQIVGMGYLSYWLLEITYIETSSDFQTTISTAANILLIASSIVMLNVIAQTTEGPMYSSAITWIATGVILYCGGTVVVQMMSNTILAMGKEYFAALWHINWAFCIITNICYARSFACKIF